MQKQLHSQPIEDFGTAFTDALGQCVTGLVNAVARGKEKELAPFGVSAAEYMALDACQRTGPTTVTELCNLLPFDAGRISRVVSSLYDRGLLRRRRLASDRRVVRLELTEDGRRLTPELVERVQAHKARLVEGVTVEEIAQLVAISQKITANYERNRERDLVTGDQEISGGERR